MKYFIYFLVDNRNTFYRIADIDYKKHDRVIFKDYIGNKLIEKLKCGLKIENIELETINQDGGTEYNIKSIHGNYNDYRDNCMVVISQIEDEGIQAVTTDGFIHNLTYQAAYELSKEIVFPNVEFLEGSAGASGECIGCKGKNWDLPVITKKQAGELADRHEKALITYQSKINLLREGIKINTKIGYIEKLDNKRPHKTIVIPPIIRGISNKAFLGKDIISVKFSEGLKSIGESAFSYNRLIEVKLPNTLQFLDKYCFKSNELTEIELPPKIRVIPDYSFAANQIGPKLILPDWIREIGSGAFYGNQIEEVYLPDKLRKLEEDSFGVNQIRKAYIGKHITLKMLIDSGIVSNSYNTIIEISPNNKRLTLQAQIITDKKCKGWGLLYNPSKEPISRLEVPPTVKRLIGLGGVFDTLVIGIELIHCSDFDDLSVKKLIIKNSNTIISEIIVESFMSNIKTLEEIEVQGEGSLSSYDGILYNKEQTIMICCPNCRKRPIKELPKCLHKISMFAISEAMVEEAEKALKNHQSKYNTDIIWNKPFDN